MKLTRIKTFAAAAAMAAALPLAAQRPFAGGPGGFGGPFGGAERLERLSTLLDLTDAQKTAAKTIFDTAKTQAEPLATQLRQAHTAVQDAVKANRPDSELDTLTARTGTLMGQLSAIHAKAQRAFRALLTDAQRAKLDTLHEGMRPGRGERAQ
jgi:periplasmic protein CpxP/Spy